MCDSCGFRYTEKKRLSVAERDIRSPLLLSFSDLVTKHRCLNGTCRTTWYECDRSCCLSSRFPCIYTTRGKLVRHLGQLHKAPPPQAAPVLVNTNTSVGIADPFPQITTQTTTIPHVRLYPSITPHRFESESLNEHLHNCKTHGYYVAVSRLVCRAAYQEKTLHYEKIPSAWLMVFLNIARIVLLTKDDVHDLLSSVISFLDRLVRFFAVPLKQYPDMPLPLSKSDFCSMITNPTNKNSIKAILPLPFIEHHEDSEHSFCRPTELIAMMMFMPPTKSVETEVCDRYRSTVKSQSYFQNRNRIPHTYFDPSNTIPSILVYMTMWSDGWDPNQSSKSNRHPVWTATGTFIFVKVGDNDNPYFANTVLMGVGPGKDSHECFFEMLVHEKREKWETKDGWLTPQLLFSKHHGRDVNVFIALGVVIQDNPERRGCADLLQGNSKTHGIFGVSCDFKNLSVPFEACPSCQQGLEKYLSVGDYNQSSTNLECNQCLGWSIDKLCSHGRYLSSSRALISAEEPGYLLTVQPCRITFDQCILGWNFAIQKFVHDGTWNATKTKAYLKLFCCNDDLQKRFIKEARHYINIRESVKANAADSFELEDLERYSKLHEDLANQLPSHPAIWSLHDILDITETPMHLMMGSIKAVLRSLLKFTTCRDRQQEFIHRCNEVLKPLTELRVDLVPVLKFKNDKFGGFVAENYSAMAMVIPWLSHILEEECMKPSVTCPVPDVLLKPYEKWNAKECKAWLKQRGHKGCSKLDAKGAKSAVAAYFQGPTESIPAAVANPGRDMPVDVIRCLLFYANALFCTIMLSDSEGTLARNRAQALVGVFLSKYDSVDRTLLPDRVDPVWIAKYNLLGLLRVPEHFSRHRHFRNQYEGGPIGEGAVKHLRRLCPNAVRDGWSRNLLKKFYRNQSLDALCDEALSEWDSWKIFSEPVLSPKLLSKYEQQKFRRYRCTTEVESNMRSGYPISAVVYKSSADGSLQIAFAMFGHKKPWKLHFFSRAPGAVYLDIQGYCYYPLEIIQDSIGLAEQNSLTLPGYKFDCFAILLPDLWTDNPSPSKKNYTIVNEDWEKVSVSGEWTTLHNE